MPYALLLIGAVLLVAGIRGTYSDLWTLVKGDFTGTNSYLSWVAAIAVIGGIGYIPKLKPLSIALLTLLLLVIVISRKGVFDKLQSYITNGIPATAGGAAVAPSTAAPVSQKLSDADTISANLSQGFA